MRGMLNRALVVGMVAGMALGAQAQIVDSSFTYQGQLQSAGVNYSGSADFVFRLWDAPAGGNFIGSDTVSGVSVTNGLFSTELDYGADAIDAPNRYLEIFVRTPAGDGSYTLLSSGRQKLNASPYAIQTRGWFTNDAGESSLTNPATGQGTYLNPQPGLGEPYMQVLDSSGVLLNEITQASGGGLFRAFESNTGQLGAAFGSGGFIPGVGGFLELDDSDGAYSPLIRLYADQDFDNTDTDADALVRLQSNGGVGAIGAQIDMENGGGFNQTIQLDGGASGAGGEVRVGDETGATTISLNGGTNNGTVQVFADDGSELFRVQEDPSGGMFSGSVLIPGAQGPSTIVMESDFGATNDPFMQMIGGDRAITFRTDIEGSNSAVLPLGSIDSTELGNEPGIASATGGGTLLVGSGETDLTSRTITCPSSGFVFVIATFESSRAHINGTTSFSNYGVSDVSGSTPGSSQDVEWAIPPSAASGSYDIPATVHGVFDVTAGSNTFYLVGSATQGGNNVINDITLTCLFIPTAYGTVNSAEEFAPGMTDEMILAATGPLTNEDILVEQLMAQQHNIDRLASELETYRRDQADMMRLIQELNPAGPALTPTPMREYSDRPAAVSVNTDK